MKEGDKVICINRASFDDITIGKQYTIEECYSFKSAGELIRLSNDSGNKRNLYTKNSFRTIEDIRDEKIDYLLGNK